MRQQNKPSSDFLRSFWGHPGSCIQHHVHFRCVVLREPVESVDCYWSSVDIMVLFLFPYHYNPEHGLIKVRITKPEVLFIRKSTLENNSAKKLHRYIFYRQKICLPTSKLVIFGNIPICRYIESWTLNWDWKKWICL